MTVSSQRIIVTGLIAQYPLGGMTWHYLQYVLGLARLGHDVYYIEDTGQWPYQPSCGGLAKSCDFNVSYLARVMERFGLSGRWAYRFPWKAQWFGLEERTRRTVIESADLLINVSGALERPQSYRAVERMAYVDSDPMFTQIKLAKGQGYFRRQIDAHDVHFSFGETLEGSAPDTGHRWTPTRQPIVLDEWHPGREQRRAFTSVMNWTSYNDLFFNGEVYGQKDAEFEHYLDLPRRVAPRVLEIAVNVGKTRRTPYRTLRAYGWHLVDPVAVSANIDSYRTYIETSRAEWSVAKNAYVKGRTGWFSERSACYLAAGKPVVIQDTGISRVLPTGEGIVTFATAEEAADAIREVDCAPQRHRDAARAIAETRFASDKVLRRLVEQAWSDAA